MIKENMKGLIGDGGFPGEIFWEYLNGILMIIKIVIWCF